MLLFTLWVSYLLMVVGLISVVFLLLCLASVLVMVLALEYSSFVFHSLLVVEVVAVGSIFNLMDAKVVDVRHFHTYSIMLSFHLPLCLDCDSLATLLCLEFFQLDLDRFVVELQLLFPLSFSLLEQ